MSFLRINLLAATLAIPAALAQAEGVNNHGCETFAAETISDETKSYESLGFKTEQDLIDFCMTISEIPASDFAQVIESVNLDGLENVLSGLDGRFLESLPTIYEGQDSPALINEN